MKMAISPVLPYWLRLKYKIYRFLSEMRKDGILEKYTTMIRVERMKQEKWALIDK